LEGVWQSAAHSAFFVGGCVGRSSRVGYSVVRTNPKRKRGLERGSSSAGSWCSACGPGLRFGLVCGVHCGEHILSVSDPRQHRLRLRVLVSLDARPWPLASVLSTLDSVLSPPAPRPQPPSSFTLHPSLFTLHSSPFTLHPSFAPLSGHSPHERLVRNQADLGNLTQIRASWVG
jgi:hypothetical protein